MDYDTIIIVDFDDTLCMHGEDKSNITAGLPNDSLIHSLNRLHDKGYRIHIYTARGHLSAQNRADADLKYRQVITNWLATYKVKYDLLSFEKPLGFIYIDDKAIRPNEIHLLERL